MSCLCFFPFDVSDGRCGIIVSIPDHCLPLYFSSCQDIIVVTKDDSRNMSNPRELNTI